jgi:hypothetical protein
MPLTHDFNWQKIGRPISSLYKNSPPVPFARDGHGTLAGCAPIKEVTLPS